MGVTAQEAQTEKLMGYRNSSYSELDDAASNSGVDGPITSAGGTCQPPAMLNRDGTRQFGSGRFSAPKEHAPEKEMFQGNVSAELVLSLPLDDWLPEADDPFPWVEIEYNRCALQLSAYTGLDEVHSLFSFMHMAQAWITFAGELQGVVTDRALIEACLLLDDGHK